jgi:hypothetical protein
VKPIVEKEQAFGPKSSWSPCKYCRSYVDMKTSQPKARDLASALHPKKNIPTKDF